MNSVMSDKRCYFWILCYRINTLYVCRMDDHKTFVRISQGGLFLSCPSLALLLVIFPGQQHLGHPLLCTSCACVQFSAGGQSNLSKPAQHSLLKGRSLCRHSLCAAGRAPCRTQWCLSAEPNRRLWVWNLQTGPFG